MLIIDLHPDDEQLTQQAAALVETFKEQWPDAWPDLEAVPEEAEESFTRPNG